ncbi:MAG TPA: putative manganese-dependent inorganic diphosphatase [Methanocellales archaeon]|nr:putative manganese-dependent inorganic diphosphatase [Methanocellales archaeon]
MITENQKRVFVIGHTNPDSDSVCSAIGYAYLKNALDKKHHYVPVKAGDLNSETKFVLARFNFEHPMEMESLAANVGDMDLGKPIVASPNDSIRDVASLMREKNIRTVPIIDPERKLLGVVGLRDIAKYYIANLGRRDLSATPVDLNTLIRTLNGNVIANPQKLNKLTGRVFIAAMQRLTILDRIHAGDVVILGDRTDIQLDLIKKGCSALIITGNSPISPEVTRATSRSDTLLISSPHDTITTARLLELSTPLYSIMSKNITVAERYTRIAELKQKVLESDYRSALIVDSELRLLGIVTRTDLLQPVQKKVILVDHNETSQAVDGVQESHILEIIDHHRVGDISTLMPIHVHNEPIGSTCTIVAEQMLLHKIAIPEDIAGLLLSGLLSDTLMLTLSTTTDLDKELARKLARIARVKIEEYGKELLTASITIKGKSGRDILLHDFKEYELGDKKIAVGQVMVMDKEDIRAKESDIKAAMESLRAEKRYDLVVLLIMNPLEPGEELMVTGDKWLIEKAFGIEIKNDKGFIPQILSRKKDFIPKIGYVCTTS